LLSGKINSVCLKNWFANYFKAGIYCILLAASVVTIISCGDKEDPADKAGVNTLDNPDYVIRQAKNVLGENVKVAYAGAFNSDSIKSIVAGTEIENKDVWGIKFILLKKSGDDFTKGFETRLLEGSFNKCQFEKIKFPSYKHELIYYNSKDYFLGSGGGEIFSYIVDLNSRQCYYAHLFSEPGQAVSLFLSPNIKDTQIKNFFVSNFKRDYPSLTIVSKDVDLKY
jgi:hypothetical protein